jgi:hypothetical protein
VTPPTPAPNATDSPTTSASPRKELAFRESDGISVWLVWDSDVDTLTLCVHDDRAGAAFELPVARDRGLDAFRHPFAYAAERDVFRAAIRDALDLQPQS